MLVTGKEMGGWRKDTDIATGKVEGRQSQREWKEKNGGEEREGS